MKYKIHHADCLDLLPTLPAASVDALITDPPYATTALPWDKKIDWTRYWAEVNRACKPNAVKVLFSAQPFTTTLINSNPKAFRYELIWVKPSVTGFLNANNRPLRAHENVLIFCDKFKGSTYNPQKTPGAPYTRPSTGHCPLYNKQRDYTSVSTGGRFPKTWLHFKRDNYNKSLHPTQKPVDLMSWLVLTFSNAGDTVLDTFAGSGSTGRACQEAGRNFIGIEKEEEYHEIAELRLAA